MLAILLLLSVVALLALIPVLAVSGAHALKRGVFTGVRDPDRNRAVGITLSICSLGALVLVTPDINVDSRQVSAPGVALLRAGVVIAWMVSFAFGWRRRLSVASSTWLYTAAAALAITWWLLRDGAVGWADAL